MIYRTTLMATILSATALGSAFAADPIKIGVVTPLSGTYAGIGQQVRWGLELATKEVNAAGGIMGRQVELIFEDEEANPSVAVQKADKLFQVNKVDFLTGTVNSGSTLAVGQMFAQRLPRQCTCRPAVFRACGLAVQGKAAGERVLSRPRL
jgi:branched-chain amino acid transport system substrate-binding protein